LTVDFWDFAITEKPKWTVWGDYLRRLKNNEIARPPAVAHWHDIVSIVERDFPNVRSEDIRTTWYRFTAYRRRSEAKAAAQVAGPGNGNP